MRIISCFSRIFYSYSDFSSYLCSQSTMTRKGYGVIIFKKVLKNDEALPSAMDSRAFYALSRNHNDLKYITKDILSIHNM